MSRIALFPGCSLEASSGGFLASFDAVTPVLGAEVKELEEWTCCGATSGHATDHDLHLALNLRNLYLAQEQGFDEIMAPCAACYSRLASANGEFERDPDALARANKETGLDYRGGVRVRNVLDWLVNGIGAARVAGLVKVPMTGLNVASYYGCLNTRIMRTECFDDREYPVSMDRLVQATGAEAIDWCYKTECCGASLFLTSESTCAKLCAKILKDAVARGADCIVVSCPMCHNNLDTKQEEIRAEYGIEKPMPVLFITQLMGLAFGLDDSQLKISSHFTPFCMPATAE